MKIPDEPDCPQPIFQWSEMMKIASQIGVAPSCFWKLSIKEWAALVSSSNTQASTMTRSEFEKLSANFGDKKREETYDQQ